MKQKAQLGILDWGIGGVSVYKIVKERLRGVAVSYFSDTGAVPYGKMTRGELVYRLNCVIDFLASKGVTHLVIGCNAASTAIPFLRRAGEIRIEGVIESAVATAAALKPERLAVIGGRRTVVSGIYRRKFAARGIKPAQRIAQPLSALIESGDTSSECLRQACRKILAPVKNASHVLLACTHYPAIIPVLKDFVSAGTVFIDPAHALVERVAEWDLAKGGADIFYTTGDPGAMKTAALNAFGVNIERAEKVIL
jgi:glutamate racemase